MSDAQHEERPLSIVLRIGMVSALTGIVVGAVLAWQHLEKFWHLFQFDLPAYGHYMLPSLILGGGAVACAIAEIVKTGRYRSALAVFGLGVASVLTPLFLGVAIAAVVLVVAVMIIASIVSEA